MNQEQQNMNEPIEEQSFAELFEQSNQEPVWLKPGQKVEARIVKISPEWVFLDLGGKNEGYLDKKELLNEAGDLTFKEGDTIRAYFLSSRQSEKLLQQKLAPGTPAGFIWKMPGRAVFPWRGWLIRKSKVVLRSESLGRSGGSAPFHRWDWQGLTVRPITWDSGFNLSSRNTARGDATSFYQTGSSLQRNNRQTGKR